MLSRCPYEDGPMHMCCIGKASDVSTCLMWAAGYSSLFLTSRPSQIFWQAWYIRKRMYEERVWKVKHQTFKFLSPVAYVQAHCCFAI